MKLADQVENWLRKTYATVKLKQTFLCLDGFHDSRDIKFITVADLTTNTDLESNPDIHLSEVDINVDVFELHGDEEPIEPSQATRTRIAQDANDGIPRPQAKIMNLPNKNLHGNGKTSLCRALAQQLSIRLCKTFPLCKLAEFDAHSMLSQYFGESGKAVNKSFAMIESMLDEDENALICVFVDEIEGLAGKRQYSGSSNEPQDSLRAVNALLIAIDRLRRWPNVIVLCTSNLVKAVVRNSNDCSAHEIHISIVA
ncbi:MAG: hypothetical protein Q9175_002244 [Cornicularia normoerica]